MTTTTTRSAAVGRLIGWLIAELSVMFLLAGWTDGPSGTPPLDATIVTWWGARDPVDAAAAVGRLIAMVLAAYLVAVTSLHLIAVLIRGRRLGRMATRLGPRFLAGVTATALLGTGPAIFTAGPATAADGPTPTGSGATMEMLDGSPPRTRLPWADAGDVVLRPDTAAEAPVPDPPPPPPPTSAAREVTVRRGDSMWSIARDELAARSGRTPDTSDIDPYWRALIALNRDRLVHPSNPSLIYPGQTFQLP